MCVFVSVVYAEATAQEEMPPLEGEGEDDDVRMEEVD